MNHLERALSELERAMRLLSGNHDDEIDYAFDCFRATVLNAQVGEAVIHQTQPSGHSCVAACVAMIVRKPVDEVVKVISDNDVGLNHEQKCALLAHYGYFLERVGSGCGIPGEPGLYIVGVPSLNIVGSMHAVLIQMELELKWRVFDPNKGREGRKYYVAETDDDPLSVSLLTWAEIDRVYHIADFIPPAPNAAAPAREQGVMGDEITCGKCGEPMRYNVPRMGPEGGYVHAYSGVIDCAPAKLNEMSVNEALAKADEYAQTDVPSVSRTLAAEVRRLRPPPASLSEGAAVADMRKRVEPVLRDQFNASSKGLYHPTEELNRLVRDLWNALLDASKPIAASQPALWGDAFNECLKSCLSENGAIAVLSHFEKLRRSLSLTPQDRPQMPDSVRKVVEEMVHVAAFASNHGSDIHPQKLRTWAGILSNTYQQSDSQPKE